MQAQSVLLSKFEMERTTGLTSVAYDLLFSIVDVKRSMLLAPALLPHRDPSQPITRIFLGLRSRSELWSSIFIDKLHEDRHKYVECTRSNYTGGV